MPKSELRLKPNGVIPGAQIVEIWHQGQFIGEITGADGPGVRIFSKYPVKSTYALGLLVNVLGVAIENSHE